MMGDQNRTARLVRDVLSRAYSPEGFAGDEECNGELGISGEKLVTGLLPTVFHCMTWTSLL